MLVVGGLYVVLCVLLGYYIFVWPNRKYKNFPPGPRPWPIIGNLLLTGNAPHLALSKFSKQYGSIVGMTMGPDKVIYIHGSKLIREALSNPEFSGKFKREAAVFVLGDGAGIAQSEGGIWQEQRRFAIRNLRELGFGRSCMEELIQENVNDLTTWFKNQNGQPISVHHRFRLAVLNSLWQILTGQRFNQDDSHLFDVLQELDRTVNVILSFQTIKSLLIFFYPKIAKLFPNWSGWAKLEVESRPRDKMFQEIIDIHRESHVTGGHPRDFVDAYIDEIKQTTNEKSSFHPNAGYNSLKSVIADLFMAGNDTTATSATWVLVYLMHNSSVQLKMQQELDRVVGRNRTACLADRKSTPYSEAVICESLRLASVAPVNAVHQCTKDVKFQGYDIPKGTHIFGNLYDSHHDPEVWGDPEVFRPERFLSPDGTQVVKPDAFIPFSTGKRVCIGKSFANDSLYLFVTSLVQTFNICLPGPSIKSSTNVKFGGLTLKPESSTMILNER